MPYGPTWRKYRALFQKQFQPNSSRYQPIQAKEVHCLLRNMARSPEKFHYHIQRSVFGIITRDCFLTSSDARPEMRQP